MINPKENPVEWALWTDELRDASEHLNTLLKEVDNNNEKDEDFEVDLSIQLGHIYSHLNRAWNSKSHTGDISTKDWKKYSEFPEDLDWT